MSDSLPISLTAIEAHRDDVYHRRSQLRLRSVEEAGRWIDAVGFAFVFSNRDFAMPTLWNAVDGSPRAGPETFHEHSVGLVWDWKDALPVQRRAFYAKLLRGKPMLVSLACAPAFYALTENFGDPDDYLAEYEAGALTLEAKKVYEALLAHGQAASTGVLRRASGLEGKSNVARFDRAIAQLQRSMRIAKVGVSDANRWGYSYVYDLLPRAFPQIPQAARGLGRREAMAALLRQHLQNVGAVPTRQVSRLFEWDTPTVERLVAGLAAEGAARGAVEGLADDCLAWLPAFQRE
ncbi:MAG: crosslink repair DNA glycosylase YcaQ family protein [Anaerolineae bacterium]